MQYNWGNVVDVSPFVLVEASGDSEAVSDSDYGTASVADEDDAESCVCDPCNSGNVEERGMGWRRISRGDVIWVRREFDDDDDGDEEGEVCSSIVDQKKEKEKTKKRRRRSNGKDSESTPAPEKCRGRHGGGYVDSNKKEVMMNEVERNKLFWETCLAS